MRALRIAAFGLLGLGVFVPSSSAAPYLPPSGYQRTSESFNGDVFAVAPDGKVAIATGSSSGNAQIRVFADAAAAQSGASPVRTFTAPNYKAWGDLTFADSNTLLFAENSDPTNAADAVYRGVVSTGATTTLGNVPNAAGIATSPGGAVYAVAANDPSSGGVYTLAGGAATPVLTNIGVGYLGGIAIDAAGNLLLTDTNDPTFVGNAGKILRYSSAFTALPSIDLAGGGGSGAYDLAIDSDGDVFVSTGATITRVPDATMLAEQFGGAFSGFPFVTGMDFSGTGYEPSIGSGTLWVNATFSDEGKVIGITVPEPSSLAILGVTGLAAVGLSRKRRKIAAPLALSLAAFASVSLIAPAHADQFFATQVVARAVGSQQQSAFADPNYALGAPRGGGTTSNSIDCYCLGNGGSVTLGFDLPQSPRAIVNAPGRDFIVSENSFYQDEDPARAFAEMMWVEVSTNGIDFARFPAHSRTPTPVGPFGTIDPALTKGFAGVMPVMANIDENDIDPFDLQTAGGDSFDLEWLTGDPHVVAGAVDLDLIRYVRLVDVIGTGATLDSSGQPLYDPTGVGIGGADVDSVAVVHGVTFAPSVAGNVPESSTAAAVSGAAAAALARRRS